MPVLLSVFQVCLGKPDHGIVEDKRGVKEHGPEGNGASGNGSSPETRIRVFARSFVYGV